jgi:hypothetical protein
MKGYIYKISSNDQLYHYYGLTTRDVQTRFDLHIEQYNQYIKSNYTSDFCTSFIIFHKYGLDNIQIQTIEQYDDISYTDLKKRERYYIHIFDCVNVSEKNYIYTNITLYKHDQIQIFDPLFNIQIDNIDQNIIHIINALGYTIQNDTFLVHQTLKKLIKIKHTLYNIITTYYPLFHITLDNNILLNTINTIFKTHNIQLIKQNTTVFYRNTIYGTYNLKIYHLANIINEDSIPFDLDFTTLDTNFIIHTKNTFGEHNTT